MRSEYFKFINIKDSLATYPDEVCFAFNPNFIEIESEWPSATFTVTVKRISGNATLDEQSIKASMYKGKCRVYISRLFELMFDDPKNQRCVDVQVVVKVGTLNCFTFDTLVVWGGIAVGERFGNLGVFNRDTDKAYYERNLIWFKQFPFTVSLFRYNREVEFYGRYDGNIYDPNPIYQDTKYCFFENIEKLAPTLPTITSGTASLPFEVVYYRLLKRFVFKKDGKFYAKCTGDATEWFGSTADYCDSANDNKPVEGITYLLESNNGFARYRFLNDELVYCGMFTDLGFEDVPPSRIFPRAQRTATIKYKVNEEARMTSVFDKTFDYTFFQTGENLCLINLQVNNETAGHYLRWIDRHGNLQYFLFKKGTASYKNKLGTDTVVDDTPIGGLYFPNHTRSRSLEGTVTHKCCAVNLPNDIFAYVVTIITAPIVDLYLGKDEKGDEIWLPVKVQSSTVSQNPKKELNDLEFSFNLPDINSQSL